MLLESPPKPADAKPALLTDVALKALMKSPPARQTDIADASTPGLSARVTPNGRVTWSMRIRVVGEGGQSTRGRRAKGLQYRLTLGTYPAMSLKEARAKAAGFVRQAEAGSHPVRALEKQAVDRHETVGKLVEAYLTERAAGFRSYAMARSVLTKYVVSKWGRLPVDSVDGKDVARLLKEVAQGPLDPETGKHIPRPGAAAEVRKWGSLLFSWAVRNSLAQTNPFVGTKNPAKLKPRQRFLDMPEARAVWQAAGELEYPWRDLIQLLMLSACRMREIAHARWSWVSELESRIVVPAEEYKTGRSFLVALPPKAMEIISRLPRWNEGDFLFSTNGGKGQVWSVPRKIVNKVHARAEKIVGHKIEHFVVHDFRRTVRTHLSRLKVSEVVGEMVLGHTLRGVAGTYNVYDFEAEKRDALTRWSEELVIAAKHG